GRRGRGRGRHGRGNRGSRRGRGSGRGRRRRDSRRAGQGRLTQVQLEVDPEEESRLVRFRIDLSYDGSAFSGWAAQPGRRTVEDVVAAALGRVLRLPVPPKLTVAG